MRAPGALAIWPAVDLKGGRVVRLLRGEAARATDYSARPTEVARLFEAEGADGIHVVDLDAAFGTGENAAAVLSVVRAVRVPVQVGGGIRSREAAHRLLDAGAARLVLGSLLFTDAALAAELAGALAGCLVGALDCRDGRPAIHGWTEDANAGTAADAARAVALLGIRALLVTDVARDGTMEGPGLALLEAVRGAFGGEILASGGVRGPEDLAPVARALAGGPAGVIVGRALHEGRTSVAVLSAARRAEVAP